jgi:hypothetical protein
MVQHVLDSPTYLTCDLPTEGAGKMEENAGGGSGSVAGSNNGGNGPFGPVAGQVLPRIG